jgi:Phosphopantetheine attachment site
VVAEPGLADDPAGGSASGSADDPAGGSADDPAGGSASGSVDDPAGSPAQADLLAYLATRLPAHLVPAAVLPVGELPQNPNGKVDHAALAQMAAPKRPEAGYLEPATPSEVEIAAIYAELLGRPRVGAADDFFALGGQSLLAVRAVTQIRQRLGVDVPLRTVFAAPTVAGLAREVDDLLLMGADDQTLLALLDKLEAQ